MTSSAALISRVQRLEASRRVRAKIRPPVFSSTLLWARDDDGALLPGIAEAALAKARQANPHAVLFMPGPLPEAEWGRLAKSYHAPTKGMRGHEDDRAG